MAEDQTDHDRLFKDLLTTFFFEFLDLFMPEVAAYIDREPPQFLDKEVFTDLISGERKEVDLLAKVRFKGDGAFLAFHFENQAKPQPNFGKRMFHYFAVLHQKLDLPIYPVAIFSYDKPQRPEPDTYQVIFPDRTVLNFTFRVIQLNRLNWRDFVRQPNPVAAALMTKMLIAPEDRPRVKLECMQMLARLKLNPAKQQLIAEFVKRYLRLNSKEKEVYDRAVESIALPEREVVMYVMDEIEERGVHKVLIRQLRKKFGSLPAALEAKVRELCFQPLEEFIDASMDMKSLAEVEAWIDARLPIPGA